MKVLRHFRYFVSVKMRTKFRALRFLSFRQIFLSFLLLLFIICVILQSATSAAPCTKPGKFLNENQTDGTHYWLCYLDENGKLASLNMKCPYGRIFDSATKTCITKTITTTIITITTTTTTTTTSTTGVTTTKTTTTTTTTTDGTPGVTTNTTTTASAAPCTEPGRFLNVNQTDGRSYWFCYLDQNNKLAWMNVRCPNEEIFDSATKTCISSPTNSTTEMTGVTSTTMRTPPTTLARTTATTPAMTSGTTTKLISGTTTPTFENTTPSPTTSETLPVLPRPSESTTPTSTPASIFSKTIPVFPVPAPPTVATT